MRLVPLKREIQMESSWAARSNPAVNSPGVVSRHVISWELHINLVVPDRPRREPCIIYGHRKVSRTGVLERDTPPPADHSGEGIRWRNCAQRYRRIDNAKTGSIDMNCFPC